MQDLSCFRVADVFGCRDAMKSMRAAASEMKFLLASQTRRDVPPILGSRRDPIRQATGTRAKTVGRGHPQSYKSVLRIHADVEPMG